MRIAVCLLGVALAVAGCSSSGGKVDSTGSVCDDFAQFVKDGRPAGQRADVVRSLGKVIDNADAGVRDAYKALANTVGSPPAQSTADDAFANACFDAGWKG